MSWMDDLSVRIEQAKENIGNDINAYIQARVVDPVVKIGQPAQGNLSQAQIQAGATGDNPKAAVKPMVQMASDSMKYLPLVILAGAALFILMKKQRG